MTCFKFQTFPDNAIKREMGSLQVVCVQSGCSWEGRFKNLEVRLVIGIFLFIAKIHEKD